jgi:hypothetical protein
LNLNSNTISDSEESNSDSNFTGLSSALNDAFPEYV